MFVFFFCCFCFCFHGVCFCLSVSMLVLFLVCFRFVLYIMFVLFLSCFAVNLWKTMFSLQFRCFWVMLVKKLLIVSCFMFLFLFFLSCVGCLQSKQWSCIVLCLCCLLSFFLEQHYVVVSFAPCGLVSFFRLSCVQVLFVFVFPFLSTKRPKTDTAKTPKTKMQKERSKNLLAQLCSQIVILILGDGLQNCKFCWNPHKNSGFSMFWKRKMCQTC